VGVLWNQRNPQTLARFRETEAAARLLDIEIERLDALLPDGLEQAFATALRASANAILILSDGGTSAYRHEIGRLAREARLPTMFSNRGYLEGGGLMSYGPNLQELNRQTATYIDRILKGAAPGDLAVEQPTTFELVVNLGAANALHLEIPSALLARADEVIE
jgi:putative ABC transport system substrate-binding protein